MSGHHETDFKGDVLEAIRSALKEAIPDATTVEAIGGGGHFEITVVAPSFAGKRTLDKHRAVLGAIAHLMSGPLAPVHAVDRITATAP